MTTHDKAVLLCITAYALTWGVIVFAIVIPDMIKRGWL